MKKITRKSLSELAKTLPVIEKDVQASYIGGGDGTYENPFTINEFEMMLNNGMWQGGFVEGYGYFLPDAVVKYYKGDSRYIEGTDYTSIIRSMFDILGNVNNGASGATVGLKMQELTRIGSNGTLYFATTSGGVFYGNQYIRTNSLVKIGGRIGRISAGTGFFIGAGLIAYEVYEADWEYSEEAKKATGGWIGGTAGAVAGAWGGAKTGGLIGTIIAGPPGGVIGSFLGGSVGAIIGGIACERIGEEAFMFFDGLYDEE